MSSSGPATAWAWTKSNISGETWTCASAPNPTWQSLRGEEVRRRMADNCQILMCKACCIIPKKTWGCKGTSAKYMNTYAMYLFNSFFINEQSCDNSVFALSLWCMECRLMWVVINFFFNFKQFNIRQQHKIFFLKMKGYEYFHKALYMLKTIKIIKTDIHIYIYIYIL